MSIWAYLLQRLDDHEDTIEQQRRQLLEWSGANKVTIASWITDRPTELDHHEPKITARILTWLDAIDSKHVKAPRFFVSTSPALWSRPDLGLHGLDVRAAFRERRSKVVTTQESISFRSKAKPASEHKKRGPKTKEEKRLATINRLLSGRIAGARRGYHQSGPAPYGYMRERQDRANGTRGPVLTLHPQEAPIVRFIFRRYIQRRSIARVCSELQAMGVKTRRGRKWSRAGIAWIIKSETYLGIVTFGPVRARGKHPRLVTPIAYNLANQIMEANNKRGEKRRTKGAA